MATLWDNWIEMSSNWVQLLTLEVWAKTLQRSRHLFTETLPLETTETQVASQEEILGGQRGQLSSEEPALRPAESMGE